MEAEAKKRAPMIIKRFSGIFRRALPTKGLRTNEATAELPIRTPISTSLEPNLER
jgi:hypothetical protein